ncbi:aldehyde dehydrogenase family protein [Arthrospiribacter ruber]|uniref:Aldehyde dehydrogenase family protein n=2 Tax=Arthrospiribacter ruber TaxID=2487934 RepID=A0A951J5D2_9BACT|nr:aldehyde dehydrogenase family protein [Arthrospiribacter ruber]MBW3470296.1 aldehyde dehydrogenase family protein [Arthrospiribacter ruber]
MKNTFDAIFEQAQDAFLSYKYLSGKKKAGFLNEIGNGLERIKTKLIPLASSESNLPEGRITGELGRTVGQIRLFEKLIEEGSWVEATIDHGDPKRTPAPKPDIRRMLSPLGPVVVFGASNFPLAFSTAGGDTISALAAGCPVIYKAHPAHPKTSNLVAEVIFEALSVSGLPEGIFTHVEGGIPEGQKLVKHPTAKAVAFTGSYYGGMALFELAYQREEPIPVFAEMGSINPVFAFKNKLEKELDNLARSYAASLTLGAGQFCTNPGLIFIPKTYAKQFSQAVQSELNEVVAAPMLHEGIAKSYYAALDQFQQRQELDWIKVSEKKDLEHLKLA